MTGTTKRNLRLGTSWARRFAVLSLMILSGCVGALDRAEKATLEQVTRKMIDFAEIDYYAKRAQSAYDSIETIQSDYPLVTRAITLTKVDARYFLEMDRTNGRQTLSVRGTAEKPNVIEDIETALVVDNILGIPLHRGFQNVAAEIYNDALPHIRKDLPIRVTGHSLGGAVAAILGAYLDHQGYTVERIVTFGQPKFTSQEPAQRVVLATTRVVNETDVVALLPFYTPVRKFQHFGEEVVLRQGPDYVYLDGEIANKLSIGDFRRNLQDFSAKDHHMTSYVSNINDKVKNGSNPVPFLGDGETLTQGN
ncbi:MAG: lipase family protein [Marinosulfonomonas sp.]